MDKKREAKSPKTSADVLSSLAQDGSARRAVAQNPNTPKEVLLSLAEQHPSEVLRNPALVLFHLEDPDFLRGASHASLASLATCQELPAWALDALLLALQMRSLQEGQWWIAQSALTTPQVLARLSISDDITTRAFVAKNPSSPPTLLATLATDDHAEVRREVAAHPQAPQRLLKELSEDRDASVVMSVLSNPSLTLPLLHSISLREEAMLLSEVARSKLASVEILRRLSRSSDVIVRTAVAGNINCDLTTLETLSNAEAAPVRVAVVGNPKTPIEIVQRLSLSKRRDAHRTARTPLLYERPNQKEKQRTTQMTKASTIFFDVGGTLLHVDWVYACNAIGLPPRRALLIQRNEPQGRFNLTQRLKRGPVHGYEFLDCCFSAAGLSVTKAQLEELWRKHLQKNLWRIVGREVRETLEALLEQKYRLAVISNSEGKVKELLEETDLAHYFELVIDSGVEGVSKPDPEIFLRGCHRMKVSPQQSLYVGDVFDIDVVGAKNAGMQAALYDPCALYGTAEAKDFLLLRSFSELTRLDARGT